MDNTSQYICFQCVSDKFLSSDIRTSGQIHECACCTESDGECWSLEKLAERVKLVFDENYILTPSEPEAWEQALIRDKEMSYDWIRDGESPVSIVGDLTGLPESICEDLVASWESGTYRDYKDPDYEDPYGSDALYAESRSSHHEIERRWRELQEELLHRSRFFSRSTYEFLCDLFEGVQQIKGYDGPIVETLEPEKFAGIYRARVAYDESDVQKILEGLPHQLGALRGRGVGAGRMNAAGVTVMYGALEEDTCIAEVRAPVGSLVVIGKFKLLRPIRVLNLKRLERCYERISLFDPNARKLSDRMAFLRSLSQRLTVPVFSHTAHLDYLVTQCISEYIAAMEPKVDGVAFASAQAGKDAMNVVLFDDACHVAPLPYPEGTTVDFQSRFEDEDETEGTRWLVFKFPEKDGAGRGVESARKDLVMPSQFNFIHWDRPENTLALSLDSLRVHRVKAVRYEVEARKVWISEPDPRLKDVPDNWDF